ncbi:hypothetical protein GRJ2_001738300 [Grus japonensis]|uniref:Uncharacterized protein n=1 Tax=Grus japonensis TaxID=30415 RepID=A0ABC9X4X1_GRUJA
MRYQVMMVPDVSTTLFPLSWLQNGSATECGDLMLLHKDLSCTLGGLAGEASPGEKRVHTLGDEAISCARLPWTEDTCASSVRSFHLLLIATSKNLSVGELLDTLTDASYLERTVLSVTSLGDEATLNSCMKN